MADDFLAINRGSQKGAELVRMVDAFRSSWDALAKVRSQAEHMWEGSDYATLEAEYGLPAGSGANVLTLLGLVDADLADGPLAEMLGRIG